MNPVPFVGVGSRIILPRIGGASTTSICARPRLVARAYPVKFASLDKLDELVALAQCRPVFIAKVVP